MREPRIKSPFVDGEWAVLKTETTTVKYRGEDVTVERQYYEDESTGHKFTTTELDDDFMWAVFRQWCKSQGFESFKEIIPSEYMTCTVADTEFLKNHNQHNQEEQ